MSFVRVEQVVKRFGRKVVFDGLDLEVAEGERLGVLGPSGVGKSVLLKMILGLLCPDRGRIFVGDRDVTRLSEVALREVRRRVGMVFQGAALFDSLTVFENVAYGLAERGEPAAEIAARVRECLALVDLPRTEALLPEQLSGGMRKRVAIARAVAPRPEIVLYDEPTTGLDPQAAGKIIELIRQVSETAVVVTHDLDCVYRTCDRIVLLEAGRAIWTGPTAAAQTDPPEPLRRFLGEPTPWNNVEASR
jgi:phospholipid/cholesterol/gamma-HCH transport system ATP-binding protein